MKTVFIGIVLLFETVTAQAQRTKIFSLSPMTKETAKVNGMVLGVGHFQDSNYVQVVNGLNVDIFLLSPIALMMIDPTSLGVGQDQDATKLISNGVNLALGGYYGGTVHHGLSIAMYNLGKAVNGVSIAVAYHSVARLNGLHIAGIGNFSGQSHGVNIGMVNHNREMSGLQLGLYNRSEQLVGIQIGIVNKTRAMRGLQLGFMNTNGKRTLPLINF